MHVRDDLQRIKDYQQWLFLVDLTATCHVMPCKLHAHKSWLTSSASLLNCCHANDAWSLAALSEDNSFTFCLRDTTASRRSPILQHEERGSHDNTQTLESYNCHMNTKLTLAFLGAILGDL